MISIKTKKEIELMKKAGEIVALALKKVRKPLNPVFPRWNLTELLKKPSGSVEQYHPLRL